ncbi:MAG: amidohydrolase family protein [Acetatifactor sp.]
MIIDIHSHIFPSAIAAKTVDKLATAACVNPNTDGTAEGLSASMRRAGIDYSVTLPAVTNPDKVRSINDKQIDYLESDLAMGILPFAGMHPLFVDYKAEMKRLRDAGIKGIKLHPAYQQIDFDAPEMMHIVDAASNEGLLTIVHGGIDIGIYDHNYSSVEHILKVVDTVHPEGLIMAHMGNWGNWEQVESDLAGAPIYMDTAFTIGTIHPYQDAPKTPYGDCTLDDDLFVRIVRKHGADRILFGTDSPWQDQEDYVQQLAALPLTADEKKMILGENAKRLLKL